MPTSKTASARSLNVSVGAVSDIGKVRKENQDRISRVNTRWGDLFLIADGVGGQRGGAQAAQMVVDGYARHLTAPTAYPSAGEALREASRKVNSEIFAASHAGDPGLNNMMSTAVLALVEGDRAIIAHIGDSRAYLVHQGRLSRVTRDHSAAQKLVDNNILTESQARHHPDASLLTRSFGQGPESEVDFETVTLESHDALVLCSDGLWSSVEDDEMEAVLSTASLTPQACADALLELALRAGGTDNISIQVLRFEKTAAGLVAPSQPSRKKSRAAIASLAGVGLAAVLVAGWEFGPLRWRSEGSSGPVATGTSPQSPQASPSDKPIPSLGVMETLPEGLTAEIARRNLADVQGIDVKTACSANERSTYILFYDPSSKDMAEQIRKLLSGSEGIEPKSRLRVAEMTVRVQQDCGGFNLVLLPPKPRY